MKPFQMIDLATEKELRANVAKMFEDMLAFATEKPADLATAALWRSVASHADDAVSVLVGMHNETVRILERIRTMHDFNPPTPTSLLYDLMVPVGARCDNYNQFIEQARSVADTVRPVRDVIEFAAKKGGGL